MYLFWTLPALLVIAAIASGRISSLKAALLGLVSTVVVAMTTAPHAFPPADAWSALWRGGWIGFVVVPYILGGLLFWRIAFGTPHSAQTGEVALADAKIRRRLLFTACFLVGPFAESATGFGIGIIGTMLLVRRLGVPPLQLLVFSLLSQTMILWGGMGSGAIVAAAYARADATALAVNGSYLLVAFNVLWLPMYWRVAARAGIGGTWGDKLSEALWLAASLALVIGATAILGPEVAMLAAYGPIIALRYFLDERPDREELKRVAVRTLPFAALIAWLVITRLSPELKTFLEHTGRMAPFAGAPGWSPWFHAGSWLIIGALLTSLLRGQAASLPAEFSAAWRTGHVAVFTILAFSMMAELLSASGIAAALARGLFENFGRWSELVIPLVSGVFGALANSGTAANGLFMSSQVSLATEAGLNLAAVIALQHVSGLALNMVSPVRMSIVCSVGDAPGREGEVYRAMLPFVAAIVVVLMCCALLIAARIL
ncbi:MAG TPA: L-lactate permease [Burkholderiales bacterium]